MRTDMLYSRYLYEGETVICALYEHHQFRPRQSVKVTMFTIKRLYMHMGKQAIGYIYTGSENNWRNKQNQEKYYVRYDILSRTLL